MRLKKKAGLSAALLAITVMMFLSQPVSAETTTAAAPAATDADVSGTQPADDGKTLTVPKDGSNITEEPTAVMFWELPELPAGQQREGTLKVVNQNDKETKIWLDYIQLPYDDTDAMTYLSALHITISQVGGETLYDGPYGSIGGANGPIINQPSLQPGASAEYHITLRCAFTYTGDPSQVSSRITWLFKASTLSSGSAGLNSSSETTKRILIIAAIALLFACILLGVIARRRKVRSQMKH